MSYKDNSFPVDTASKVNLNSSATNLPNGTYLCWEAGEITVVWDDGSRTISFLSGDTLTFSNATSITIDSGVFHRG